MADFRKWILVLAVLSLFAGLASAQSGSTFQCNAQAAVPPQLRSEGLTELTGDIVITCTGGVEQAVGTTIPTANFTIYMASTVTSRLLGNNSVTNASEALLLIDDPGTGGGQYGNTVAQTPCGFPLQGAGANGCVEDIGTNGTIDIPVAAGTTNPGANVFQGVVSGSSVTFYGIPIQPPVSSGAFRTFRITNVRVNANAISGGTFGATGVTANIAISGSTSVPITNSLVTVGYVSKSLNTSQSLAFSSSTTGFSSSIALNQCQSYGKATAPLALETLRFQENQASAFKVRGTTNQITPGFIYATESGLTVPGVTGTNAGTGGTYNAGYADWGTRLKAVFTNIPSGVTLYVSVNNLNAGDTAAATLGANSSFASLITGETSPDSTGNAGGALASSAGLPLVTQTGATPIGFAPVVNVGGSGSAVWEVVNSLPNTPENFDFEVLLTVTSNPAASIPPAPSTMTVNMSYAPIPTQGAFTSAAGTLPSAVLGIPRFADTSVASTALTFSICQTALLFPYVTYSGGFDTGLAIANTSSDPFATSPQAGSCAIWWYGPTALVPTTNPGYLGSAGYQTTVPTSSEAIAAGTVQAWLTSTIAAPGYTGYVIAVCNFQYAHGFAFVSDLGARNLAMGYLADVMNAAGGQLENRGPVAEGLTQ